jgi:CRISPR/Cas system endoribonuclease Cas6 (RAMP superfamily)
MMDSQIPQKLKKEHDNLVKIYLDEDDTDWNDVLKKNASKEYREYVKEMDMRDKELLKKGVIEN